MLRMSFVAFCLTVCLTGCNSGSSAVLGQESKQPASKPEATQPVAGKRVAVGKNVWFEKQGETRRVHVAANVCLREGHLEEFLCRKNTKEHESILHADVDARDIHQALLLAGAEPGAPVQFQPQYKVATGQKIKVTVQYEKDGKLVTVPAGQWIRNIKTQKDLGYDWVFTGSLLVPNPLDKDQKPTYLANGGDVISVSNFEGSMLDLPFKSSQEDAEVLFEAHTERIPAEKSAVMVILEPAKPSK